MKNKTERVEKVVRFREVLFKKNFFSLWLGQIVSEFGDRLNQMALIALVYSKSPGSVIALANLLFFIVIPVFVIGPFAGVYVDRWDRKKVMVIADIVRGILVFTIPIFIWLDFMVPIYVIVFLMFSATRFFLPSKLAFIPEIVPEEKLLVANSLTNTTRMLAVIFGFAIAGFIVKWVGHMWGFYIDGISFFLSAGLIATISPNKKILKKEDIQKTKEIIEKSLRKNVWKEIVEGFHYIIKNEKMVIVTSALFVIMAGTGSVFCIIIVFIQNTFGSITSDLGIMGVFLGIGLFAGTVFYGKLGQTWSKLRTMFISFGLCGVTLGWFAVYMSGIPDFITGAVLMVFIGATVAPILTCTNTLIHILVPDEVRGRIFSSMEAIMHLAFLVFMFFTASLAKVISGYQILLISSLSFALISIGGSILIRRRKYIL